MILVRMLEERVEIINKARMFALEKHRNQKRPDGITPFVDHLEDVVSRLKNLGISEPPILCAAWLHDIIEKTDTTFEEIDDLFGNTVSVLVLSLTKDLQLPKKDQEIQYVEQLKNSSSGAKLIKFCDIATNLKDISNSPISKNQKNKQIRKLFHYLRAIKKELSEKKSEYPKLSEMSDGINSVGQNFRQRPIII